MDAHFEAPTGSDDFDLSFKVFHELMARKVTDILLISSPYEAFIMEEEGRLAERIIHEYRGLNLSRPPMLTWASTSQEALEALHRKKFDLVITMPLVDDTHAYVLGRTIKQNFPDLPVFLLVHKTGQHLIDQRDCDREAIDRVYVWQGNSDLLLALIKNLEDRLNVAFDTERARVRVIVLVEDAPVHYSSLLPILYKEIVTQTQAAMEESVNDEHRIFRMRARPKILVAQTYEEAVDLCRRYQPYLLSVLSDVRFPRGGVMDEKAGVDLLSMIRAQNPDLPLLTLPGTVVEVYLAQPRQHEPRYVLDVGPPLEIYHRPKNRFTADFIGQILDTRERAGDVRLLVPRDHARADRPPASANNLFYINEFSVSVRRHRPPSRQA